VVGIYSGTSSASGLGGFPAGTPHPDLAGTGAPALGRLLGLGSVLLGLGGLLFVVGLARARSRKPRQPE
jgi:hypothetical protein